MYFSASISLRAVEHEVELTKHHPLWVEKKDVTGHVTGMGDCYCTGESSCRKCLVTRWLRTVRPACCGSRLPGGYDVFRTVPARLEYQPIVARIVYTWLEDHCLYFRSEGSGGVAYLKGGLFFLL